MTKISVELSKHIPTGEVFELPEKLAEAIRYFKAYGFEITINGRPFEAYTSVGGAMPEVIAEYGAEMLQFVTAVVARAEHPDDRQELS